MDTIWTWILGGLVAVYASAGILFFYYAKAPASMLRKEIFQTIYWIDEFCDHMDNREKRDEAINIIGQFLGWRRAFVPAFLIGWAVDLSVAIMRKMGVPDLHQEEAPRNDQNIA